MENSNRPNNSNETWSNKPGRAHNIPTANTANVKQTKKQVNKVRDYWNSIRIAYPYETRTNWYSAEQERSPGEVITPLLRLSVEGQ